MPRNLIPDSLLTSSAAAVSGLLHKSVLKLEKDWRPQLTPPDGAPAPKKIRSPVNCATIINPEVAEFNEWEEERKVKHQNVREIIRQMPSNLIELVINKVSFHGNCYKMDLKSCISLFSDV